MKKLLDSDASDPLTVLPYADLICQLYLWIALSSFYTGFTHSFSSAFYSSLPSSLLPVRLTVATARATKRADKAIAKIGFILFS